MTPGQERQESHLAILDITGPAAFASRLHRAHSAFRPRNRRTPALSI
jgi:hypothetical protein